MDKKISQLIEYVKNDQPLEVKNTFREIMTSRVAMKLETFRRNVAKSFFNKTK